MKTFYLLCLVSFLLYGCSNQNNSAYQKVIVDFLENNAYKGVRTDLQIKFMDDIVVSDISVADSVTILQQQYEKELAKKVESAQKSVTHYENTIKKQQSKGNDIVAKALIGSFSKNLEKAKDDLDKAKSWKPGYLNRYDGKSPSEIIAKKATCRVSFLNPSLSTRQEVNAIFILSSDGSKVHYSIKAE
jgi:hypothetical protein